MWTFWGGAQYIYLNAVYGTCSHRHGEEFNPFTADPVKALHFAIVV